MNKTFRLCVCCLLGSHHTGTSFLLLHIEEVSRKWHDVAFHHVHAFSKAAGVLISPYHLKHANFQFSPKAELERPYCCPMCVTTCDSLRPASLSHDAISFLAAYHYTPVKQQMRVLHEWHPGHLLVTALFFLGVVAFSVFALVQFTQRPATESFFMAPSTSTPIPIEVSISCSHAWACYNNASRPAGQPWRFDAAPRIASISGAGVGSCTPSAVNVTATNGLAQIELNSSMPVGSAAVGEVVLGSVQVCYSASALDGLLISVPGFTAPGGVIYGDNSAPRLQVRIRGVAQTFGDVKDDAALAATSDMDIQLDIEPHQRKSVFIGAVLRKRTRESAFASLPLLDADTTDSASVKGERVVGAVLQPYMADLFYEGKNDGSQAHLRVRVRQYVDVFNIARSGDLLGMFASIGGFAASWGALMSFLLVLSELFCLSREKRMALDALREKQALAGVGLMSPESATQDTETARILTSRGSSSESIEGGATARTKVPLNGSKMNPASKYSMDAKAGAKNPLVHPPKSSGTVVTVMRT